MYLDNLLIRSVSTEEEPIYQMNKKNKQFCMGANKEECQRVGKNVD